MSRARKKGRPASLRLPNKFSRLIHVALRDLEAAERAGYRIDMAEWISRRGGVHTVCFAGAVLARYFELENNEVVHPLMLGCAGLLSEEDERKMHVLNRLRLGLVSTAFREFGRAAPYEFDRSITPYEVDSVQFKREMRQLADDLEAGGY